MSISTLNWDQTPAEKFRGGVITIGNFDGVHLGHTALIAEARRHAQLLARPAVAISFDPHPLQLLRPAQFQPVLTSPSDRAELLQAAGADHVLLLQTTPALLNLTAAEFFRRVIQDGLAAHSVVEGPNFGFGHNREGDVNTLRALCGSTGLNLIVVPPVQLDGKPVSSSRVRNALLEGNARKAIRLLQRPYRLRGTVARGQQRGRTIGFPTANLEQVPTLIPGDGVYAARVYHGNSSWPGAANIGANPTFGEHARKVEIHLMGFEGDLLGQTLAVDFLERLRDTRPFANVALLVEQLHRDVDEARRIAESAK